MQTRSNGIVIRGKMRGPAPLHKVAPSRLWFLDLLSSFLLVVLLSVLESIKDLFVRIFKKKKSVKGNVVVITGSGRGLGRGVALEMSRLGAYVACVDINSDINNETVKLIKQEGGKAEAFTVNVAKSEQVEQLVKDVERLLGPADLVINNAALIMPLSIDEMTHDDIRAYYEVNCMGPAFMTKAFLRDMIKRNSGHIVAISSLAAKAPVPWLSLYCSTKSALSKFYDSLHVELNLNSNNNVKVTAIHPYFINTSSDYSSWFKLKTPLLQPQDVVDGIMDGILYDKSSVFIPRYFSFICAFEGFIPLHFSRLQTKYLGKSLTLPSRSERDLLPYNSIVENTVVGNHK